MKRFWFVWDFTNAGVCNYARFEAAACTDRQHSPGSMNPPARRRRPRQCSTHKPLAPAVGPCRRLSSAASPAEPTPPCLAILDPPPPAFLPPPPDPPLKPANHGAFPPTSTNPKPKHSHHHASIREREQEEEPPRRRPSTSTRQEAGRERERAAELGRRRRHSCGCGGDKVA